MADKIAELEGRLIAMEALWGIVGPRMMSKSNDPAMFRRQVIDAVDRNANAKGGEVAESAKEAIRSLLGEDRETS